MIKIENERLLLPIVRNPLANWTKTERLFIPLFQSFVDSKLNIDKYEGWAYSVKFIKNSNIEYQDAVASMDMSKRIVDHEWTFAPSLKDHNKTIWIFHDTAVVVHHESWLWFG